jgi:hypothetical protein
MMSSVGFGSFWELLGSTERNDTRLPPLSGSPGPENKEFFAFFC